LTIRKNDEDICEQPLFHTLCIATTSFIIHFTFELEFDFHFPRQIYTNSRFHFHMPHKKKRNKPLPKKVSTSKANETYKICMNFLSLNNFFLSTNTTPQMFHYPHYHQHQYHQQHNPHHQEIGNFSIWVFHFPVYQLRSYFVVYDTTRYGRKSGVRLHGEVRS
jgi:hypothetical protein